ncbi:sucrose-6-phosphate hydrolase [Croceicoccus hydrothermalis]|uniref:sucrose-6-phosphate hydrolase n=1 Tax=Croceicoccus hydrothermalis TaxID=2867964 RepID=UPI001EFAC97C|nr:sucrose-6-phosphate hydrolase [Croceicoccus hydrothermalis]
MGPLVLTDLDDTLFQTLRKCPPVMGDCKLMSTLADGSPSGYASDRQVRFIEWLNHGLIVPVTARSREVLERVAIRQAPAICANGGCIIDGAGNVDQDWHAHLKAESLEIDPVREIHLLATDGLVSFAYRHWIVQEGDLELYFVVKANGDDLSILDEAERRAAIHAPQGWRIHRNGNNLAVLPPWLNKRHAARHLIEIRRESDPHLPVIGIGDSHSDVGFMDLCDFAMTPTNSQVWTLLTKENGWCS